MTTESASFDNLAKHASAEVRHFLSKAKWFYDAGRLDEAIDVLSCVGNEHPGEVAIQLALGQLFWKKTDITKARIHFKAATDLDPKLEIASLALFHVLWSANMQEEALQELERFVKLCGSAEYDKILRAFDKSR